MWSLKILNELTNEIISEAIQRKLSSSPVIAGGEGDRGQQMILRSVLGKGEHFDFELPEAPFFMQNVAKPIK